MAEEAVGTHADPDQPDLAAARALPGHESDPSRELATVLELPAVADARHQRRRDYGTDAWHTADAAAEFALPAQYDELVIEFLQPWLQPAVAFPIEPAACAPVRRNS
jgi:hypothetical protein